VSGLRDLLGASGTAALAEAQRAVAAGHQDVGDLSLTWSAWTRAEWNFTFLQRHPPRRLVVHVPHEGGGVTVRVIEGSDRPGTGPLP
jgi:hypothetical protein